MNYDLGVEWLSFGIAWNDEAIAVCLFGHTFVYVR